VAETRRDDFPNNYVGDLVRTDRGWAVVPPTCCRTATTTARAGGRLARCGVAATAGTWRGDAGAARSFTRPSRGRIAGSETEALSRMWEDEQRRTPDECE
jgi:hypothetical protein